MEETRFNDKRGFGGERSRGEFGGERGGFSGHGGGMDECGRILSEIPDAQLIFLGSVNCIRHKPYWGIAKHMREGKVSMLCPTMSEFATGRYLTLVKEAIAELMEERGAKRFVLMTGCQWVILSSDGELLMQEVRDELGAELTLFVNDHLETGDHQHGKEETL